MTRQITSRRADNGLPDVMNDFRTSDGTYYGDGFTTTDMAGCVLAGQQFEYEKPRLKGYALSHAFAERAMGR